MNALVRGGLSLALSSLVLSVCGNVLADGSSYAELLNNDEAVKRYRAWAADLDKSDKAIMAEAEKTSKLIDQQAAEFSKRKADRESSARRLQKAVTALKEEVTVAKKVLDEARAAHTAARTDLSAAEADTKKLGDQISKANSAIQAQYAQAMAKRGEKEAKLSLADARIKALEAEAIKMEAQIKEGKLGMKLSDLSSAIEDKKVRLLAIENALNNSVMAEFMKAKMQGMLNDSAFCNAQANCSNPSEKKDTSLEKLFSSTAESRSAGAAKSTTH